MNLYCLLPAILCFVTFLGAGLIGLLLHSKLPIHHRSSSSHEVLKSTCSLFSLLASVLLAFLIGGLQAQFGAVDLAVKAYGTDLIMLDDMLHAYGPDAQAARRTLHAYTERVLATVWPSDGGPILADPQADHLMQTLVSEGFELTADDHMHRDLASEIVRETRYVSLKRVQLILQGQGGIPTPFLLLTGIWIAMCFTGMGFNAPVNPLVITCLVAGSFTMAVGMFLVIDLGTPFSGLTRVSSEAVRLALSRMKA